MTDDKPKQPCGRVTCCAELGLPKFAPCEYCGGLDRTKCDCYKTVYSWDDTNGILKNGKQYLQVVAGEKCTRRERRERRKTGKMIVNFLNEVKP